MLEETNLSLQQHINYLNMMFEVSSIANQTDDVYELVEKTAQYIGQKRLVLSAKDHLTSGFCRLPISKLAWLEQTLFF